MLLEAGYTMREAVVQLVAHAPTPATFAVGVAAIVESPLDAWAFAADRAASADLTALGERYGFSADETSPGRCVALGSYAGGRIGRIG